MGLLFIFLTYACVLQKEKRSKKRAELNSLPPPSSKPKAPKRKSIIHESKEKEEEEEEECPLKKRPRDVPQLQPPSASASVDPQDQVLQPELNEPVVANPAVQSPPITAAVSANPLADIDFPNNQPITQPGSSVAKTQETSSLSHQLSTPPASLSIILDEELEAYFNAPITQPSAGNSSLVHQHLQIIEEDL